MVKVEHDGSKRQFTSRSSVVTEFTMVQGVTKTGSAAFMNCEQLASLAGLQNSSVTTIGVCSFQSTGITSLKCLPPGLRKIEEYAFGYCPGLINLHGLQIEVDMNDNAFSGCNRLLKSAKALGFPSINEWIRGRALRFSVLACIKIARDREAELQEQLLSALAAQVVNQAVRADMAIAITSLAALDTQREQKLVEADAMRVSFLPCISNKLAIEVLAVALGEAKAVIRTQAATQIQKRSAALRAVLSACMIRLVGVDSPLLIRIAMLPDALVREHIVPFLGVGFALK